jgi:hypothetical protein
MPAAEGPQGIFRACQEADAAVAGCIGMSADAAGAEKALPQAGQNSFSMEAKPQDSQVRSLL